MIVIIPVKGLMIIEYDNKKKIYTDEDIVKEVIDWLHTLDIFDELFWYCRSDYAEFGVNRL